MEAELWAGILRDNGIRCLLKKGSAIAGLFGGYTLSSPFVPCEVYVLEGDEEEAKQMLESVTEADEAEMPPDGE